MYATHLRFQSKLALKYFAFYHVGFTFFFLNSLSDFYGGFVGFFKFFFLIGWGFFGGELFFCLLSPCLLNNANVLAMLETEEIT